jgi:hypothetical protein
MGIVRFNAGIAIDDDQNTDIDCSIAQSKNAEAANVLRKSHRYSFASSHFSSPKKPKRSLFSPIFLQLWRWHKYWEEQRSNGSLPGR